jgi:hypothetical protein
MTKKRSDRGVELWKKKVRRLKTKTKSRCVFVLVVLEEQLQVDLEDGLEQTHVGTLVQTDLVFPDVDNQDLAGGQCEQGTLALKVLVLSTFAAVGTLDIHDQDVVCHLDGTSLGLVALVLAHPDSFGGLTALRL